MQAEQNEAQSIRIWLEGVIRQSGMKPTPLAKRAGLAPSTVLRALDPEHPSTLDRTSVRKIAEALGVAGPNGLADMGARGYQQGFSEPDLLPYIADEAERPADLMANQYEREVGSRVLELAGYLPGDIVRLDMATHPEAGDAVDVQIYGAGNAETVFRLYDPPYLVTRTADPALQAKPLLVDGERVRIAAVAVSMRRRRPTRA